MYEKKLLKHLTKK